MPDVVVVNVTKDAIWARKANLPHGSPVGALDPRLFFAPGEIPDTIKMPDPTRPRETQQEQFLRDMEIDPHEYYPPDVDRDITDKWPEDGITMDVKKMLKARGIDPDE